MFRCHALLSLGPWEQQQQLERHHTSLEKWVGHHYHHHHRQELGVVVPASRRSSNRHLDRSHPLLPSPFLQCYDRDVPPLRFPPLPSCSSPARRRWEERRKAAEEEGWCTDRTEQGRAGWREASTGYTTQRTTHPRGGEGRRMCWMDT